MLTIMLRTGASSGIGRATCIALGNKGWNLTLTGRRESELNETAKQVREANPDGGSSTLVVSGDINQEAFVARWVRVCT
jgi:NADP-dependent 3-hydroxy acid dehydrogenase YdfG